MCIERNTSITSIGSTLHTYIRYIYIYICVCVYICVCDYYHLPEDVGRYIHRVFRKLDASKLATLSQINKRIMNIIYSSLWMEIGSMKSIENWRPYRRSSYQHPYGNVNMTIYQTSKCHKRYSILMSDTYYLYDV